MPLAKSLAGCIYDSVIIISNHGSAPRLWKGWIPPAVIVSPSFFLSTTSPVGPFLCRRPFPRPLYPSLILLDSLGRVRLPIRVFSCLSPGDEQSPIRARPG